MSGEHRAAAGAHHSMSGPVPPAAPASTDAGHRSSGPLTTWVVVILCGLLGFGIALQVRRTAGDGLSGLRADDLVEILDRLQQQEDDIAAEIVTLEGSLARLRAGGASSGQALVEAQRQAAQLGILAGTTAAHGPGVTIEIDDPARAVSPEILLDTVQELRNAGAEAIQIGDVRIGVDTAFTGDNKQLMVDGRTLSPPLRIRAIGDAPTLSAALAIPGGVIDSVKRTGAGIRVGQAVTVVIDALRAQRTPQYARPAG